ncbi:MAG: response regulator transcription factor [Propionibacteriaceae bacterium]|nr:response regulator transcription factor [Propionibacteriaceae bacterium]
MAAILLITDRSANPLPPLSLLPHQVTVRGSHDQVLTDSAGADVVIVDARDDLVSAKSVCQMFGSAGIVVPRLAILAEGGLAVYSPDWNCADFILDGAGPAEYDARLRILAAPPESNPEVIQVGGLLIDEAAYSVVLDNQPLELTYTEFELLKYLALHPGRVFSREHLLAEVWGYDYYGGTRTVDVHVRRLRAKLGPEHEALIGTVRNVGYRFAVRP